MANYDNLTPAQQARFDQLMTMKMGDWPDALRTWVRDHGPIYCGDQMAHEVAGWVRSGAEEAAR
jgi:hypothetical protein